MRMPQLPETPRRYGRLERDLGNRSLSCAPMAMCLAAVRSGCHSIPQRSNLLADRQVSAPVTAAAEFADEHVPLMVQASEELLTRTGATAEVAGLQDGRAHAPAGRPAAAGRR